MKWTGLASLEVKEEPEATDMFVYLIIISLYGGIDRVAMSSLANCEKAAAVINSQKPKTAEAYCIQDP